MKNMIKKTIHLLLLLAFTVSVFPVQAMDITMAAAKTEQNETEQTEAEDTDNSGRQTDDTQETRKPSKPTRYSGIKILLGSAVALVLGSGLVYMGWKFIPSLWKFFFGGSKADGASSNPSYFNENTKVTCGKSLCIGHKESVNDHAHKIVLQVKNQFDADGGGSASCGYHTVKNFVTLRNAIAENASDLQKGLMDPSIIEEKFGKNGPWRAFINATEHRGGEWARNLDGILRLESEEGNGTFMRNGRDYKFTVVDNIAMLDQLDLELAASGDVVHGFAIQTSGDQTHNSPAEAARKLYNQYEKELNDDDNSVVQGCIGVFIRNNRTIDALKEMESALKGEDKDGYIRDVKNKVLELLEKYKHELNGSSNDVKSALDKENLDEGEPFKSLNTVLLNVSKTDKRGDCINHVTDATNELYKKYKTKLSGNKTVIDTWMRDGRNTEVLQGMYSVLQKEEIKKAIDDTSRGAEAEGHWKLLLFHKTVDNKREYILCDSCNTSRLNDSHANKIIETIEKYFNN